MSQKEINKWLENVTTEKVMHEIMEFIVYGNLYKLAEQWYYDEVEEED